MYSFLVGILLVLLVFHFRHPMVYSIEKHQRWSVASGIISEGESVTPQNIISFESIDSLIPTDFIADPFFLKKDSLFYLFVEHLVEEKGVVSYLTSPDFQEWSFDGIIINEPFHMSYPQVFEWEGEYYMIPETTRSDRILLYEATSFPTQWSVADTLIEETVKDPTFLYQDGYFYLFGMDTKYVHRVFVSSDLKKGWKEHPQSPIGIGNKKRSAGSVIYKDGKKYLPVQGTRHGYGSEVYVREIKKVTPSQIEIDNKAVLLISAFNGVQYFQDGVHHIDMKKIGESYYYVIDGWGCSENAETVWAVRSSIVKNILDVLDFFGVYEIPDLFY